MYVLLMLLLGPNVPEWLLFEPLAYLGCGFWLVGPIGFASGALVLDERADVARLARVGMWLNACAFAIAVLVSCLVQI